MHAMVTHVTVHDRAEARRALDEQVIPAIKAAPGYVGAYFVALDEAHGVSMAVFDTEDQAKAAMPPPESATSPGVTVDRVQFGEVMAAL